MKTLKEWLPQLTIGVVVISFLNLHFYYGSFGIYIQHYVEVSEIIFSLTTFISSAIYISFISLGLLLFSKKSNVAQKTESNPHQQIKLYRYFRNKRKPLRWLGWFFERTTLLWYMLSIILLGTAWATKEVRTTTDVLNSTGEFDLMNLVMIGCFCLYLMFLSLWYKGNLKADSSDLYRFSFVCLIGLIMFIGIRNSKAAELVKEGHPKFNVHLVTADKHYSTNDTLIYVGALKNYYFFYDCKANVSTVIPASTVKEVQFRRIRTGL